jgi:branched-chain amino acid transport system substrate-binding protein
LTLLRLTHPGLLSVLLLLASCSTRLKFEECTSDADCSAKLDGGVGYCDSNRFCVAQVPLERLCTAGTIPAQPAPNSLVIGGLFRLTGSSGSKDTERANAAQLAMEQIAQVSSRPVAMVLCDTAGSTEIAVRSAEKLIQVHKAAAIVGPSTSGQVLAVANTVVQSGVLLISPSATSSAITSLNDDGLIWRTSASDDLQAVVLSTLVKKFVGNTSTPTTTNVAYVNTPYGVGLKDLFVEELSMLNGAPPKATYAFDEGSDAGPLVARVAADLPNYSVFIADLDVRNLLSALYTSPMGLGSTSLLFTDAAKDPSNFGDMPVSSVLNRVRGTAPGRPRDSDPTFSAFRLGFQDKFGSDPSLVSFTSNTFDATFVSAMVVVAAASGGKQPAKADLVRYMKSLSDPNGAVVEVRPSTSFVKGVTTLEQGGTLNLTGASGPLDWLDNGDLADNAPIEVWGVDTRVSPPTFCDLTYTATRDYPCP